jgi:hypothetical protein
MAHQKLIGKVQALIGEFQLAAPGLTAGSVSCALLAKAKNVDTEICLDLAWGIEFCAEHVALAEMLKAHETEIVYTVSGVVSGNRAITLKIICKPGFGFRPNRGNPVSPKMLAIVASHGVAPASPRQFGHSLRHYFDNEID